MTWRLVWALFWVAASIYGLTWAIAHDDTLFIVGGIFATSVNSVALGCTIEKRGPS